jgi:hypothetical protein
MSDGFPLSPPYFSREAYELGVQRLLVREESKRRLGELRDHPTHTTTACRKGLHADRDSAGGYCAVEVRAEEVTTTSTCTSKPDCDCKFCGSVRLLLDQEAQRARTDINQLAEQFVEDYLNRRG